MSLLDKVIAAVTPAVTPPVAPTETPAERADARMAARKLAAKAPCPALAFSALVRECDLSTHARLNGRYREECRHYLETTLSAP
jgi:hypothetical protein